MGSLPKSLLYGPKPEAVQASVSQYAVPVANGSSSNVSSGGTFSFNIPSSQQNTFLDPSQTYLKFKVTPSFSGTGTFSASGFAHDFIKSFTLSSSEGQQAQETINNYSVLHSVLRDLCSAPGNRISCDSICINSDPARQRAPNTIDATAGFTFCMPLVSSIGTLSGLDRLFPVCALSAPLRADFVLNSAANALAVTGGPTSADYVVSNISLNLTYVRLTTAAMQQIMSMTKGMFMWSTSLWKDSSITHYQNTGSNTLQLASAKCRAAKTLIAVQRLADNIESNTAYSNTDRIKNYLSTAQWKIGSDYINSKPLDCSSNAVEVFQQAMRAFGVPTSEDRPTQIDITSWVKNTATTVGTTAQPGSFLLCQDIQAFPNQAGMIQGQNTLSNQPYLDLVYDTASIALVKTVLWTLYTECEAVATIVNGQLSIVP